MSTPAHRTVLVTGAGGFIGSHLCNGLVKQGAQVRALCRYTSRREEGSLAELPGDVRESIEVEFGDVRDGDQMMRLAAGVDAIYHLAASISVPYSFVAPRDAVETNIGGTLNLLNAAMSAEVSCFVQMSSSEVYGTARYAPIDEQHPLGVQSPYAASKVGADKLAESFHLTYGLGAVIARPFNTFGPRQSLRAVIPTVAAQALAGGELHLGSLNPRRDFVFVEDTAAGLMALAATPSAAGGTFNIATGHDVSVGDVVALVGELLGRELVVVTGEERIRPENSEVQRLIGDATRLREMAGWVPQVSLREGLSRVIDWLASSDLVGRSGAYAI